jgi:hypothetical protein
LACEIDDGSSATVNITVGSSDAHFEEQDLGRQGEKSLHTRVLQGGKAEAARFEGAAEAAGERGADGAITVEEDPAAGCVPSFTISYF